MKYINIFVAGSKTLDNYRNSLVLWANGKNYKYRKKGNIIQINVYSFKEVGDDQDSYNRSISEDSDITLFLVEGTIGDRTKEELNKAKSSFIDCRRPEIWVFTKRPDHTTSNFLQGALGNNYSIDFETEDDLVNKVNTRIDDYVEKLPKRKNIPFRIWWTVLLLALFTSILGWAIGNYTNFKDESEKKMLLIAGGGSVTNFIESQTDTNFPVLADYRDGYFLHLPTKSAWTMLVEEVISLQDTRRYYPVCISATEATDEDFCSAQITQKMYLDSAVVVSCKLGMDSLAVYIQKDSKFFTAHPECEKSKRISIQLLKNLVMSKEMNVYSTSFESGTRAGYCKVLGIDNFKLNNYLAGQFSELFPISAVSHNNKPYMLLGSQYYQMNAVKNDAIGLTVESSYAKPMMVYFMAYRVSHDIYKIPEETRVFLGKLKLHSLDDYISKDGTIKIKNHSHVIYNESNLIENSEK